MLQYVVLPYLIWIKLIITSIEGTQSFLDILLVIWNKHIIIKDIPQLFLTKHSFN
jgi:hypothetical protein